MGFTGRPGSLLFKSADRDSHHFARGLGRPQAEAVNHSRCLRIVALIRVFASSYKASTHTECSGQGTATAAGPRAHRFRNCAQCSLPSCRATPQSAAASAARTSASGSPASAARASCSCAAYLRAARAAARQVVRGMLEGASGRCTDTLVHGIVLGLTGFSFLLGGDVVAEQLSECIGSTRLPYISYILWVRAL